MEGLHQDVVEHFVGKEQDTRGTAFSAVGCDPMRGVVVVSLSQVDQLLADQLVSQYVGQPIEIEQECGSFPYSIDRRSVRVTSPRG